jgi:D-threonine aldolase
VFRRKAWYEIESIDQIDSPALIVYRDRIQRNIEKMVKIAGNPNRLMPHVKTHKIKEVVKLQLEQGIRQFKCATIAEAEMLAEAGAEKVLIAMQPVGPKLFRIVNLIRKYPKVKYSVIIDNPEMVLELAELMVVSETNVGVFIDLNVGMNRTGILPGEGAKKLTKLCLSLRGITLGGYHAYDGHNQISDLNERREQCIREMQPVYDLIDYTKRMSGKKLLLIAGGTPTFQMHASVKNTICSPGTTVLWDFTMQENFPDLPFEYAALIVTRVISKVGSNLITFDLGHKAVAADSPMPRVKFLDHPEIVPVSQSEEHLVAEVPDNSKYQYGDFLYGIPGHICPTCALYQEAAVIDDHRWTDTWKIEARDRFLTI